MCPTVSFTNIFDTPIRARPSHALPHIQWRIMCEGGASDVKAYKNSYLPIITLDIFFLDNLGWLLPVTTWKPASMQAWFTVGGKRSRHVGAASQPDLS